MNERAPEHLPDEMQTCLRACLATGNLLDRNPGLFTPSSGALAKLLRDWSRRQIAHHLEVTLGMTADRAATEADIWLQRLGR